MSGGGDGKVMGFGFTKKAKKSVVVAVNAGGEDDDAPTREYLTGVTGSGLELKDKKAPAAPKSIPVQDNTFEVGTGRRRKAPSFLPDEAEVVKDNEERFETAERIGGKGETAQSGDVVYGLTKMGPKGGDVRPISRAQPEDSFIGKSLAEKELQAFKEDVEDLPEQATLDDYESMPIADFGAAMLRGMGWEEGKPVGRNSKGLVAAVEFVPRPGRLGLGASGAPPPTNDRKRIKPGETREAPAEMVLAEGPEGKSRNVKSLDEKLVKKEAPGAREGKTMIVAEGRHRGLRGRVLRLVKEEGRSDRAQLELSSSGEVVTVRCSELADLGTREAEAATRDGAGGSKKRERDGGGGESRKEKRERREEPAWLRADIRVRIVSKSFQDGRLYLKKASVADVLTPRECVIEMMDGGEVLSGVPQRVLETALPKRGGRVVVLTGPRRGQRGKLLDKKGEAASVQLSEDFAVQNFTLDSIAEYTGVEED
jgi:G patch domain/KOW motif-containing protein